METNKLKLTHAEVFCDKRIEVFFYSGACAYIAKVNSKPVLTYGEVSFDSDKDKLLKRIRTLILEGKK